MAKGAGEVVRVRVICESPRPETYGEFPAQFGLQDKNRSVDPGELLANGSRRYECDLKVKRSAKADQPDFGGPYVHGAAGGRFLYLTWHYCDGGSWHIIRRLKVHLKTITWAQVEAAQDGGVLEARVDGRGAASVPLLGDGWTVSKR